MFSDGAKPTPENYAVWNVSADGLVITFNEYQVAAYAAGPQEVVIPFVIMMQPQAFKRYSIDLRKARSTSH